MAQWDDAQDDQPYPQPTTAPRITGPVTDPHDPRLADPTYANDPNVLTFLTGIYGNNGTAFNPPAGTPGWDPQTQTWNAPAAKETTPGGTTTPPPTTPPPTGGAPPPSVGTSSDPGAGDGGGTPGYTPPAPYVPPPAFSFDPFSDPSADDVLNDPGYQFERDQGLSAIGANRAAAGTLNTGGTLKDYVGFANNLASTHYGQFRDRKLSTYATNRQNALDTYNTNYGTQYRDPWTTNYQSQYTDPFQFDMQGAGLKQNNTQFNASLGQNNNQFNSTLSFNKWLEDYKRSTLDPFDQKYKTLSLL